MTPDAGPMDFERMLRMALTPVDPPDTLKTRVETTLQELTDAAVDELEAWELGAMRDPRNWPQVARPVAAVAIGGAASAALVVVRVRAGRKKRRASSADPLAYVEQTVKAVADEARRVLDR